MEKATIKKLFPIEDQNIIIAHLESFEWNFKIFGAVYLCFENQRIKMRYAGCGNHEGTPTLSLELCDSRYLSVKGLKSEIANINTGIWIERDSMGTGQHGDVMLRD